MHVGRVTGGREGDGGGVVIIFAVRIDNLCSLKADGRMAEAVLRSEDEDLTWKGHRHGGFRDCHSLNHHPRKGSWAYEYVGLSSTLRRSL